MPSRSPEQRRFMAAASHDSKFARKANIPQSVAKEFHEADETPELEAKSHSRKFLAKALRKKSEY